MSNTLLKKYHTAHNMKLLGRTKKAICSCAGHLKQ